MGALRLLRPRCAAGRRGSALWCGVAHRAAPSAVGPGVPSLALTVWPPSLAAETPVSAFKQCQHQGQPHSRSRSFVTALNGFTSPPPQPRCTGCARLAVASSLLVPVLAISAPCGPRRGPPCLTSCLAGLASPHPADASPSHSKLRNGSRRVKTRFNRKRLMAAADAAAMMWLMQTGKSQRGGSVSAGKSARRGVRVKTLLSWQKNAT